MGRAYIGTSGYHYAHWEGVFYPPGLPRSRQLEYYARFFDTVELNVTFYRLLPEKTFINWHQRTPSCFQFSVKGSRYITHIKRLKDCEQPLATFFSRIAHLKEKAAVVLWQLPPNFKKDMARFKDFLELLKTWSHYRHAFEFRHPSWFDETVYDLILKVGMTVCLTDWPTLKHINIPPIFSFLYLRRHGASGHRLYTGLYSRKEIEVDAQFILSQVSKGKAVFVYFNNDAFGHAIKNALELKELLKAALPVGNEAINNK